MAKDHPSIQFEILAIEAIISDSKEGNPQIIFDDKFCIIWILEQGGTVQVDLQKFVLEKDMAYYVRPGQYLSLEVEDDVKGYVISFAREFVELFQTKASELFNTPLFNHHSTAPDIKIGSDVKDFMQSITGAMLQEFISYRVLRSEILKGFLKIFIIYLSRQAQSDNPVSCWSRKTDLVNLFFSHLEKNYSTKKMVKEYAVMQCVTPSYLNDTVKEVSGYTASYHIQQRVVLEAKRRAFFDGYSMKQAAYDLGFFDPSHFSKYFKKSSGVNFTDFRKGVSNFC